MAKPSGTKKGKGSTKKKNDYTPVLDRSEVKLQMDEWQKDPPRLNDQQIQRLSELAGIIHDRHKREFNRQTFPALHRDMEKEVVDRVYTDHILKGMWAGLEWRAWLSKRGYALISSEDPEADPFMDGILPTSEVLDGPLFDDLEMFQPRIIVYQFERQANFLESAEEAVEQSNRRAKEGDGYFTDTHKLLTPEQGGGNVSDIDQLQEP